MECYQCVLHVTRERWCISQLLHTLQTGDCTDIHTLQCTTLYSVPSSGVRECIAQLVTNLLRHSILPASDASPIQLSWRFYIQYKIMCFLCKKYYWCHRQNCQYTRTFKCEVKRSSHTFVLFSLLEHYIFLDYGCYERSVNTSFDTFRYSLSIIYNQNLGIKSFRN